MATAHAISTNSKSPKRGDEKTTRPKIEKILGYSPKKMNEKSFLQLVPKSDFLNAKLLLTENWDIKPQAKY